MRLLLSALTARSSECGSGEVRPSWFVEVVGPRGLTCGESNPAPYPAQL